MYLFSGTLVVLALATQAGYAWLSPLMDQTTKVGEWGFQQNSKIWVLARY